MDSALTTFTVAESHYLAHGAPTPLEICANLDLAVQIDLRHHFSGPLCAAYWIDLCRCREYGHDRLLGAIEAALPKLVEIIRDRLPPRARLDVVSLGPGDGEIDIRVLGELRTRLDVASYRCVDFSLEMLEHVVRRLIGSGTVGGLPLKVICADFTGLDGSDVLGDNASLLLLTGYTIGNNIESRLLGDIASWMRPGDLLLIDGRLGGDGSSSEPIAPERLAPLVRCYDNEASNRFAFGPVEMVTTASCRDVKFDYRVARRVTTVPGAINIVIGCSGLEAQMRLTGELVARDHLDLASTTVYDFAALRGWLAGSELNLLFACRHEDTGVFVLEKPRPAERREERRPPQR